MGRPHTLICTAMPFGYGPAAKLIAIAQRLRGELRLVFLGRGSALELVSRARQAFDEIVEIDPGAPEAAERMAQARGVLSLMDREAASSAARVGAPLFGVDSLLWMRSRVPEAFASSRVYFAQRFPGLSDVGFAPRPTLVGPILAPLPAPSSRGGGLVVHLGGSAAPRGREALYRAYARLVLRAVVAARLPERFGQVAVLGGAQALAAIERDRPAGVELLADAAPDAARERMARARAVLTAPGLTATLECFHDGTPTWLLPPQNYSQWCILRHLRAAGAADDALHWEDLPGVPTLRDGLPAQRRDPIVCSEVERLSRDSDVAARLAARLAGVGREPTQRLARQRAFVSALGPPSLERIASALRDLLAFPRRASPGLVAVP